MRILSCALCVFILLRQPVFPASPAQSAAGSQPVAVDLLSRASAANEDLFSALQSFVCNEQIERFTGRAGRAGGRRRDTITARLSMENGDEHYTDIHREDRPLRDFSSLDGAWSEGEFGTLLKQSEQLLTTQTTLLESREVANGVASLIYSFHVAAIESPWDLEVGGQHYTIPFQTKIWISETSGKILKIERTSTGLPPELRIAQIDWSVTLGPVNLNGREWLLPHTAEYSVMYSDTNRNEWNTMQFSNYRRYGAETTVRFN